MSCYSSDLIMRQYIEKRMGMELCGWMFFAFMHKKQHFMHGFGFGVKNCARVIIG